MRPLVLDIVVVDIRMAVVGMVGHVVEEDMAVHKVVEEDMVEHKVVGVGKVVVAVDKLVEVGKVVVVVADKVVAVDKVVGQTEDQKSTQKPCHTELVADVVQETLLALADTVAACSSFAGEHMRSFLVDKNCTLRLLVAHRKEPSVFDQSSCVQSQASHVYAKGTTHHGLLAGDRILSLVFQLLPGDHQGFQSLYRTLG